MALLFWDSYDNYTDLSTWWTSVLGGVIERAGNARTGPGNLALDTSAGPIAAFGQLLSVIVGTAFWPNASGQDPMPVFEFMDLTSGFGQVLIGLSGDFSIAAWTVNFGANTLLCESAPGVTSPSGYNYIEARLDVGNAGAVTIRVNGVVVASASGVGTIGQENHAYCNGLWMRGANGGGSRHDDTYVLNPAISPNVTFLGPVRIFSEVPIADTTTDQWTPEVVGPHYQMVDSVPPNLADFNYSNTVGAADEYEHPITGIPTAVAVLAVGHKLLAGLDAAGSRSIGSSVNEIVGPESFALSTTPLFEGQPYDFDPVTGVSWLLSDIPMRRIGPVVTA